MALHGSGGAYYRSNATIPSSVGLHSAYTRHLFVKGASAPSNANLKVVAALVGNAQNPHDAFNWSHTAGGFDRAHQHRTSGGSYSAARYPSTLATSQWLSIGATFSGSTLTAYLEGSSAASAGSLSAAAANAVYADMLALITFTGSLDGSSNWTDGEAAEYAYWNVALTADEMAALAKGFRATRIRPQSLVFYAPCVRELQDIRGGRTLVKQAGTDVPSDHPRVF